VVLRNSVVVVVVVRATTATATATATTTTVAVAIVVAEEEEVCWRGGKRQWWEMGGLWKGEGKGGLGLRSRGGGRRWG